MSKKFLGLGIFAGLALVVMLNVHLNNMNKDDCLSKVSLMNISALSGENDDFFSCSTYCKSDPWYICWISFSNGFTLYCDSQTLLPKNQ
jgi:hypothetical protein